MGYYIDDYLVNNKEEDMDLWLQEKNLIQS
jgi:hypothetical protein